MPSLPNLPVPGLSRTDEEPSPDELMRIYFRRHLAAAGAGAALFRRVASSVAPDMRMRVAELARVVERADDDAAHAPGRRRAWITARRRAR